MTTSRKQLDRETPARRAPGRRSAARCLIEVRVGDRYVRWVGVARARRLCQDRELARRVIPARGSATHETSAAAVPPRPTSARGVFGEDFLVLARVAGPRLPITSVTGLARQVRRALMSFADPPVAEIISGHRTDGTPAQQPHLAVVPLPAVTGPDGDGALLGVALVLPRELDDGPRVAVLRAVSHFEARYRERAAVSRAGTAAAPAIPILLGDAGVLMLQRGSAAADLPGALRPATWVGPARRWISATPIALDRHPGDLHHPDPDRRRAALGAAAACVREAVRRIGLPAPVELDVLRSSTLPGTAPPQRYPRYPGKRSRPRCVLVHARLGFDEPVRGPMLVGAGRYHGLGLLLPVDDPGEPG